MRNMSFMLTTGQMRDRSKTVTRRLGWSFLKPGDRVMACKKCMGLKKGESIDKIWPLEIVSVRKERLDAITQDDVGREGFAAWNLTPEGFVAMFCKHMKVTPDALVNRIEFRYLSILELKS